MIMAATAGMLTGAVRISLMICVAPAWDARGTTFGPGAGGGGGASGGTSVVTSSARPRVCGEIIGASSAHATSSACPVNPIAVVHTRFPDGP